MRTLPHVLVATQKLTDECSPEVGWCELIAVGRVRQLDQTTNVDQFFGRLLEACAVLRNLNEHGVREVLPLRMNEVERVLVLVRDDIPESRHSSVEGNKISCRASNKQFVVIEIR